MWKKINFGKWTKNLDLAWRNFGGFGKFLVLCQNFFSYSSPFAYVPTLRHYLVSCNFKMIWFLTHFQFLKKISPIFLIFAKKFPWFPVFGKNFWFSDLGKKRFSDFSILKISFPSFPNFPIWEKIENWETRLKFWILH